MLARCLLGEICTVLTCQSYHSWCACCLQDYLAAMSCAANYAWVNRSSMTFLVRQAFAKHFKRSAAALDMHVVYDVSHNIAKVRFATFRLFA